jgi:hypothetical protein
MSWAESETTRRRRAGWFRAAKPNMLAVAKAPILVPEAIENFFYWLRWA